MTAILDLRNVDAAYGSARILQGVELAVEEGGITTLLGANGAGKATEDIVRLSVAHVPDGRGTFLDLTVEENLRIGTYVRRDKGVAADFGRLYGYFPRLKERRRQLAGTLSGGEQQMLAISRALMLRPKLLLLDEPSFRLAPLIVQEIFRILRAINRNEGVGMLLVEQNVHLALELADHAYLIDTGCIVMGGPAAITACNNAVCRAYLGY